MYSMKGNISNIYLCEWTNFQQCHGENRLHFDEMMVISASH